MATLFRSGDGESANTIIIALELVDDDWFRRNLIGALELMCREENWTAMGTATIDYARDKANEMLENLEIDVIIPTLPVGTLIAWAEPATIPAKYLLCNGQAISRATYAELFALLNDFYGAGNGTTTFNLPDYRTRVLIGAGVLPSTTAVSVGGTLGEEKHALVTAELATHNHGVTDPGHTHPPVAPATVFVGRHGGGATDWVRATAGATFDQAAATGSNTTGISTQDAGSGTAHNNIQPSAGVNWLIYAGV